MSAFDDEFGLFGDEAGEEEERKSTLGARKIASNETIIDEIEPEDEPSPRRFRGRGGPPERRDGPAGGFPGRRPRDRAPRAPLADDIAIPRAVELLTFLAQKLVSKPAAVHVNVHRDDKGTVLELEVSPDDIGKVIGRAGRVAQALRTIVRAGAEGRVTVDIVDVDDDDDATAATAPPAEDGVAKRPRRGRGPGPRARGDAAQGAPEPVALAPVEDHVAVVAIEESDDDADDAIAAPTAKRAVAKKTAAKKTAAKPAAKKTATKLAATKAKAGAAKAVAKKAVAKKTVAKSATAKKATVAKATAKKATAVKATSAKKTAAKKSATSARKKKS